MLKKDRSRAVINSHSFMTVVLNLMLKIKIALKNITFVQDNVGLKLKCIKNFYF